MMMQAKYVLFLGAMEMWHAKIQLSYSMLFLNHHSQFFPFLNSKSFYFLRKKRKRVLHGRTATEKGTIAYELMLLPHIYNNAPHFVRTALLLIFEVCEPTFVLDDWGKQRLIKRASAFLSPYLFPWKVCLGSTTTRVPPPVQCKRS
jgi:hypothetical protein